MSSEDVGARKKKLDELRGRYMGGIDATLEDKHNKGLLDASKKLRVLRKILLSDEELPTMSFLLKAETILRSLCKANSQREQPTTSSAVSSTDDDCQILEVTQTDQQKNVEDCPRSPSPENIAGPSQAPKLIPTEKQKSLLDLPMPIDEDIDERPPFLDRFDHPSAPRPPVHRSGPLPNSIARLIEKVHTSSLNHHQDEHHSRDTDLRFPNSDMDMRESAAETFEPTHFEEAPSPPRVDIDLNNSDDDDLVIDEAPVSPNEPAKIQLPPPVMPLKPPPKPPLLLSLGSTDLESLCETASSAAREKPSEPDFKSPADDFIPSRQVTRVPSSLMASRTGTMQSPRPMASPRPRSSSVRVPQSPAYNSTDLFAPDAVVPKYQFAMPKPTTPASASPMRSPESLPKKNPEPQPTPISLPDFIPPSAVTFQPPKRPSGAPDGPPQGFNQDPRAANRDPRMTSNTPPRTQNVDPRRAPNDPRIGPSPDPRMGPNPDPRMGPNPDPRMGPNPDPRMTTNHGPRMVPSNDPRSQSRWDQRPGYQGPPGHHFDRPHPGPSGRHDMSRSNFNGDRRHEKPIPRSYKEHRQMREMEEKRQKEEQRKKRELSLKEKKNKEQEERRRKEAEERMEKLDERLQKKTDIVRQKVQSKQTSKVQCIEPLPLPASEMKKMSQGRRPSEDRRSSTDSEGSSKEMSLEKVSPLNSLYGAMPQPQKTKGFKIPKKPKPQRSPSPPRKTSISPPRRSSTLPPAQRSDSPKRRPFKSVRGRSPTPPRKRPSNLRSSPARRKSLPSPPPEGGSPAESSDDDGPHLVYDSPDESTESTAENKPDSTMKPDSTEPTTPTEPAPATAMTDNQQLTEETVAEMVRKELQKLGYGADVAEKKPKSQVSVTEAETTESVKTPTPDSIFSAIVRKELSKMSLPGNPEVSSSSNEVEEPTTVDPSPTVDSAAADVPEALNTSTEDEAVDTASTEGKDSLSKDGSIEAMVRREVRKQRSTKGSKKNELDKLQEDLRESFIADGVMTLGPRNRQPVDRFSAEGARKRPTDQDAVQATPSPETEPEGYHSMKKARVVLNRLPEDKIVEQRQAVNRRQVAKRARVRPSSSFSTPRAPALQVKDSSAPDDESEPMDDDDGSEKCPSIASDDSGAILTIASRGGMPTRGPGRGRGRGGRRHAKKGPPDTYPPRVGFDLQDPSYVWQANKPIPCSYCMYEGKKIVEHFVTKHPLQDVLISRLTREEAKAAMLQPKHTVSPVLQCRFCRSSFSNCNEFRDHVTEHTGEYRYQCTTCPYKRPKSQTVSQHMKCQHQVEAVPDMLLEPLELGTQYFAGFLCGYCNFVQLNRAVLETHIENHQKEEGLVCSPGLEEINEINMSRVDWHEESQVVLGLASIKKEKEDDSELMDPVEDPSFLATLDDLLKDVAKQQTKGKSILESIRKSKSNESEPSADGVKRINIPQISLRPSTSQASLETRSAPSPPPAETTVAPPLQITPEKDKSRNRSAAIVGICYACGETEPNDVNNLFKHIREKHPATHKGNCPDCSRRLTSTDHAIKHIIEEHIPSEKINALLAYWNPQVQPPKSRKSNLESTASAVIQVSEPQIPLEDQPPAPQHAKRVKNSAVYASMIELGRLCKLYKCMGRNCSFVTDMPEKFMKHIDKHKTASMGRYRDWQECVYCMEQYSSGQLLLDHIHEEHNKFVFQCSMCFYRSASESNVHLHQKIGHQDAVCKILQCQKEVPKSDMPSFTGVVGNIIKPYSCITDGCDKSFYRTVAFIEHLQAEHSKSESLKCHECEVTEQDPEALAKHYEVHGFLEFNCLLCTFGAESQLKLHNHLCVSHPNYSPCLAARSLLGLKTEKNMLAGALRGLEPKALPIYQPPQQSDEDTDSEEDRKSFSDLLSNETMPSVSPQSTPTSAPVFSRTLSAIMQSQQSSSATSSPIPSPVPRVEKPVTPAPVASPEPSTSSQPDLLPPPPPPESAPVGPPPVTRPLSTFSTFSKAGMAEKEKTAPPPVTQPLSTFSRAPGDSEWAVPEMSLSGRELFICCNSGCKEGFEEANELDDHLMMCVFTKASAAFPCVHCSKPFKSASGLIDHLRVAHGPPRFTCGVCTYFKSANSQKIMRHLKAAHGVEKTVLKPENPFKTNENLDKFIVLPKVKPPPKPQSSGVVKRFNPDQEDLVPKTPIFPHDLYCALCDDFKTRVRTNFVRHLRSHKEDGEAVSSAPIPINPAPALKTGELNFNKMDNWAKSSHVAADGTVLPPRRSSQEVPQEEVVNIPNYIKDDSRYVCGIISCCYKTSDPDMLKMHLDNLHSDAKEFKCVHCPDQKWLENEPEMNLFEGSVYHMKQHGPNLFRCRLCQRVETSKEDMKSHFEASHENEEEQYQPLRELEPVECTRWNCSECAYSCQEKDEMKHHCFSEHNILEQFRCSQCPFRAAAPDLIFSHHAPKEHPGIYCLSYASFYPNGMQDARVITGQPTPLPNEPSSSVKHIRSIRIEEVGGAKPRAEPKELQNKKLPVKSSYMDQELIEAFGGFGAPDGNFFVCPRCETYKNRQAYRFKEHLYKEFDYKKYSCKQCNISVVSKLSLQKHLQKIHQVEEQYSAHILVDTSRPDLDAWANAVSSHQGSLISRNEAELVDPVNMDTDEPVASTSKSVDPYDFTDSPMEEAGPSTTPAHIYNVSPSKRKKSLNKAGANVCKHCGESFKTIMALKMHIKLYHYKAGKFICGYCDVSANSESIIINHSRKHHPDQEPNPKSNPNAVKVIFDESFWDSEYGIIKTKDGSMMREGFAPETEQSLPEPINCQHCSFKTSHPPALKRHLTSHKFRYGCPECDLESENSIDIQAHFKEVHRDEECTVRRIHVEPPAKIRKVKPPTPTVDPMPWPATSQSEPTPGPSTSQLEPTPGPSTSQTEPAPGPHPTTKTEPIAGPSNAAVGLVRVASPASLGLRPPQEESPRPPSAANQALPNSYKCKYCPFTEDRLKKVYGHYEAVHKSSGDKFQFDTINRGQVSSKQCKYCNQTFKSEKDMREHFKQFHPEYVTLSFAVMECKICKYRTDEKSEAVAHIRQRHKQMTNDSSLGLTSTPRKVKAQEVWCLCEICNKHDTTSEAEMVEHCRQAHPNRPPRFIMLNNKGDRLVRELGQQDQLSPPRLAVAHPSIVPGPSSVAPIPLNIAPTPVAPGPLTVSPGPSSGPRPMIVSPGPSSAPGPMTVSPGPSSAPGPSSSISPGPPPLVPVSLPAGLIKKDPGQQSRSMYICPIKECGQKTKSLKGMEEHVRSIHVTRMVCLECKQFLAGEIAAKMHVLIEHKEPSNASANSLGFTKVEEDVQKIMLLVKREGEDEPAVLPLKPEPK